MQFALSTLHTTPAGIASGNYYSYDRVPLIPEAMNSALFRIRDHFYIPKIRRMKRMFETRYIACRAVLGESAWARLSAQQMRLPAPAPLSIVLSQQVDAAAPAFLRDLALLEEAGFSVLESRASIPLVVDQIIVNPTLRILEVSWKNLAKFLEPSQKHSTIHPQQTNERIFLWYDSHAARVVARPASNEDILVLKIVVEKLLPERVAAQAGFPIGAVDRALFRAAASGLILTPPSRLTRDPAVFGGSTGVFSPYLATPSFTLQWHITQDCDLSCKHCYDRSRRQAMGLDQAIAVLDDLRRFCLSKNVSGAVSFTGGNPLLHPAFTDIYRAAAERGFSTALLGNPSPRKQIEAIVAIHQPSFFQVSLEGLQGHNDEIRGQGHFKRTLAFLDILKELEVSSMVMLTLTNANLDQVIPLADLLREKTDVFHFNRLSLAGEGAQLKLPDKLRFQAFLRRYLAAAETNPVMGIKDNFINILRKDQGLGAFGGCTGHGCGAAFNFVSLLPDGEVHACRKFPSLIGTLSQQSLAEIYDSKSAARYRAGSEACGACEIRPVCGGCLAGTYSHGRDIFKDKDPFCFMRD